MEESKKCETGIIIGIDASRNRSGGAKAHLVGILTEGDPFSYGISEIHVWSYSSLLDCLPERPWLIKHSPPYLNGSIFKQLWWQRLLLKKELIKAGCEIILNTDAGTIGSFLPSVTMSRDMLSYEPGEIERFGFTKMRIRLLLLRYIQNRSLRIANGAIFLTRYAGNVIQKSCGILSNVAYISHGVGKNFKSIKLNRRHWPKKGERPIHCLYVSPIWIIKHQWVVVRAIEILRKKGYDIRLTLIGQNEGVANNLLKKQVAISDPEGNFVSQVGFVQHKDLPEWFSQADIFIFASSCENMPNSLIEAMAVGLPIACSNRGPMPEVLEDAGVYFDPENDISISNAVESIIKSEKLRTKIVNKSQLLSEKYSWLKCSKETFSFIISILNESKNKVNAN